MARLVNIDRKLNILSGRVMLENFFGLSARSNFVLPQRDWLRTFRLSVSEALAGGW